jgi:hypothetical protein
LTRKTKKNIDALKKVIEEENAKKEAENLKETTKEETSNPEKKKL